MAKDTIFDLTEQYQRVEQALLTYEDNKLVEDTLVSVKGPLEDKITNYGLVMTSMEDKINEASEAINRIQAKKKRWQNNVKHMQEIVIGSMEAADINKVETAESTVKLSHSTKAIIDDVEKLPSKYVKITQSMAPDKNQIKQDIKNGVEITGAHVEQTSSLKFK